MSPLENIAEELKKLRQLNNQGVTARFEQKMMQYEGRLACPPQPPA